MEKLNSIANMFTVVAKVEASLGPGKVNTHQSRQKRSSESSQRTSSQSLFVEVRKDPAHHFLGNLGCEVDSDDSDVY
jgi:hypothetical protein